MAAIKSKIETTEDVEKHKKSKITIKKKNIDKSDTEIQTKNDQKESKDKWSFHVPNGVALTDEQKKQKAYLIRMKKINKTPRRMKKGKNRHIRCDQGKPTGRSTPWAQALKLAKEELKLPTAGVMIFPVIGSDLHTTAKRIMKEIQAKEKAPVGDI